MKAIPFGVVGLVLLSCLWSACEKSTTIGSGIFPPGSQLITARIDTMTVRMYTVQDDPAFATNLAENLLGSDEDPLYGRSAASFYTQFSLTTNNLDFAPEEIVADGDTTYTVDSLVLSLRIASFQGDESVPQSFEVYRMTEHIRPGTSYESSDRFATESTPVGSISNLMPRPDDSVQVGEVKLPAQIRIPLDSDLAQELFDRSGTREFESNDVFRSYFPGLFVTPTDPSTAGYGRGFFRINLQSVYSEMSLYYRRTQDIPDTFRVDTLVATFPISTQSSTVANYTHGYAGAGAIEQLGAEDSVLFFQGMGGLKIKLEIPHLEDLGTVALNRATLRFPLLPGAADDTLFAKPAESMLIRAKGPGVGKETVITDRTYTDDTVIVQTSATADYSFNPRPRDTACHTCTNFWAEFIPSTGSFRSVIDQFFSGFEYGGDRTEYNIPGLGDVDGYEFNLTLEFQAILDGNVENNGFLLIPFPYFRIASRGMVGGFNHPELKRRAQLEIIYTEVN